MIAELFLSAALALPCQIGWKAANPMSYSILRVLSSFYHEDGSSKIDIPPDPFILVVDNSGELVEKLRTEGARAWELTWMTGLSKWSIQGFVHRSPIRKETMHIVWAVEPPTKFTQIVDIMAAVRIGGFFIVDLTRMAVATYLIERMGFQRMSYNWYDYTVYRKINHVARMQESA